MKKAIVKDNEVLEEYGLKLSEITNEIKNRFNIPAKLNGVLIVSVSYDGRARRVGLQIGDVIYKVNNISINSIKEIKKVLEDNKNLNYFYIYRNGRYFIVKM
jgi:serine protease Do